jgi:hypothetical protein
LPSEEKFGRKHLRKVLITFPQTEWKVSESDWHRLSPLSL